MNVLWQDLRLAVRALRRAPGFALAAIAALALGIGPNTAIFSVVHATLLAPLPFPEPEQLVIVWSKPLTGNRNAVSAGDYLAWKSSSTSFEHLDPLAGRQFNLSTADAPQRVNARVVGPDGHRLFREGMALGRDFLPEENQPGRNRVVLLSNRLWRTSFGADPSIIGREIRLDDRPYTVVGVLPTGTSDRLAADIWMPLTFAQKEVNHGARWLMVLGRLKPGVTIERAQREMESIAAELARREPGTNKGWTVSVEPLQNNFLSPATTTMLWLLLAAVGFVVLIACVNVANLLLARGTIREREVAIRASLGASRARVIRQMLTESVVLAAAGGALGVLSAAWFLQALLAVLPAFTLPAEVEPHLNVPVLLFALLMTVTCGLLFGAAPAWQASRVDPQDVLKQSGRSAVGGGRRRLRDSLVLVELTLAVAALAGAGLAIHSFWMRAQVDLGARAEHALTFALPAPRERLNTGERIEAFYRGVLRELDGVPGVMSNSVSTGLPVLSGTPFGMRFRIADRTAGDPSTWPGAGVRMVTPGYFQTFGATIVRGRGLTDADKAGSPRVALVSQQFVDQYLAGLDPLRQRIDMEALSTGAPVLGELLEWQIVGVFRTMANGFRPGVPSRPEIVLPFWQSPWPDAVIAVRTAGDPNRLRLDVTAALHRIEPGLPLVDVRTIPEVIQLRLASDRMQMVLFGALGAVALLLAALGIYSVMAFSVAQRTSEIGLRMALGAGQSQVRREILREGLTLALGGLALGVVAAYAVGRAMQTMLFGTEPLNVPVLFVVAGALLASALAACYVPARRASAVDPMSALRQD